MPIMAAIAVPHPPIILPAIGRGEEKKIQKTSEACLQAVQMLADLKPDTVILTSPHSVLYADYFHVSPGVSARGDFSAFGARSISVEAKYDSEFVQSLSAVCREWKIPAGTLGERDPALDHGTMIPLWFLNQVYTGYRLVRIGLSGLSPELHYHFGQAIARTADCLCRKTVLIASGDLSHKLKSDGPYGYAPEGPEFDRLTMSCFENADFLKLLSLDPDFCEAAAECGLRSYWIMAGVFDRTAVDSKVLSYEGPFGVGYGVAVFRPNGNDESRDLGQQLAEWKSADMAGRKRCEDAYVRLARQSIETFIRSGKRASLPDNLPAEMLQKRAGVFVSLKKDGQLRGCIGTIEPTRSSIAQEILCNAVDAATQDPRFSAVREDELVDLVYSVDVLGAAEPILSESELDPKRYGVIVEKDRRRGLLLPSLAGVDTAEQQIAIARQKAGIAPSESIRLSRFEVVRHK